MISRTRNFCDNQILRHQNHGIRSPQPPELSQLHVLIAVADCSSFSEAALQLQMSQSAISYAIATLEEDLGVVLFSRGRYGAHLTPVGEQVVDRARQVTYLLQDMVRQANLAKGLHGGQVRISAFRSAATQILPEVIAQFCRQHPATIVNMVAQGLGAAISPRLAAEPIPLGVQVYSLPVPLFREICVAVLADALLPPATYAFLELLKLMLCQKRC